jgi:hypothetical protein
MNRCAVKHAVPLLAPRRDEISMIRTLVDVGDDLPITRCARS